MGSHLIFYGISFIFFLWDVWEFSPWESHFGITLILTTSGIVRRVCWKQVPSKGLILSFFVAQYVFVDK